MIGSVTARLYTMKGAKEMDLPVRWDPSRRLGLKIQSESLKEFISDVYKVYTYMIIYDM